MAKSGNINMEEGWRKRAGLNADDACELADAYLLSCELLPGAPAGEALRLARAQWLVMWALLRARDEALRDEPL